MVFFLWRQEQDLGETAQAGNLNKKKDCSGHKKKKAFMVFFLWRQERDLGETAQAGNLNPKGLLWA